MHVTPQQIVDLLNDAYRLDSAAINDLVRQRVPCNERLATHPTIATRPVGSGRHLVGVLGILNAVAGIAGEEVRAVTDEHTGDVLYFQLASEEEKRLRQTKAIR